MSSETFYFSHDYNSRNDDKIKRLVRKHGMEGYGIYWAIVEDLYNNANALTTDYEGIAFELRTTEERIYSIINDFDLFIVDGAKFGSSSIARRMSERNQKSSKARESANKRWANMRTHNDSNANEFQMHSDSNAIKESKVKESKVKERESTAQQVAAPSPIVDEFSKKVGELISEGVEAKANQTYESKKKNANKPTCVDDVLLELTRLVPTWSADELQLRAEQWYTAHEAKYPGAIPWRISNKEVKDWKAALRNKVTYWKIELNDKKQRNETTQRDHRRAAIQSGAVKKFD